MLYPVFFRQGFHEFASWEEYKNKPACKLLKGNILAKVDEKKDKSRK
jgi:hypothetical protein